MVQDGARWCKMVQDGARWCKMVQDGARWCKIMQYHIVPCNTMQYQTIPCNTMLYHAIPCNSMQYYAILCNTMQYHAIACMLNTCWRSVPLPCGQYKAILISSLSLGGVGTDLWGLVYSSDVANRANLCKFQCLSLQNNTINQGSCSGKLHRP